jgi:hypothetical protein
MHTSALETTRSCAHTQFTQLLLSLGYELPLLRQACTQHPYAPHA